jgi:tetratricopeptide (TPR) repeat protein
VHADTQLNPAALEQMPGEPSVERLAYHFSRAGDTAKAAHYLEQAGDRAWVLFANVEAETAYRELLAHLERLGRPADRARAYEKLSLPLRFLGRHTEALAAVEAALGLYQMLGDVEGQGRVLARLGHFHAGVGTPKEGLECVQPLVAPLCAAGLSLSGQSALSTALSRLYYNIAENTDITEESEKRALQSESLAAASQAEALAEQAHDENLLGLAMSRRGATLLLLEREEEGAQVLEDAIRLLEASGDLEALWVALNNVGNFYLDRGEYTLALPHTERALAIAERLGDQEGIADKKQKRGDIFFALGQWEQARQNLDQADAFLREAPVSFPLVFLHFDLGLLALAQRQAEEAAEHFRCALVLAEQIKHPYLLFWASSSLADLDLVEGRPEGARARLEPFLDRSSLGAGEQAWVRRQLGWASLELGDLERAEVLLEEASTLARAHHLAGFLVGVLHSQARMAL